MLDSFGIRQPALEDQYAATTNSELILSIAGPVAHQVLVFGVAVAVTNGSAGCVGDVPLIDDLIASPHGQFVLPVAGPVPHEVLILGAAVAGANNLAREITHALLKDNLIATPDGESVVAHRIAGPGELHIGG